MNVRSIGELGVLAEKEPKVVCDANILCAFVDSNQRFHKMVRETINNLYSRGVTFYYVVPCLLELKEYWRRKRFSEAVEQRFLENYPFFRDFRKKYASIRPNIIEGEYLRDYQIKSLRSTLDQINDGRGVTLWKSLCKEALDDEFTRLASVLETANILYAKLNDEDIFPKAKKDKWPKWEDADKLVEWFCLGSNDAAIINMANSGEGIHGFLTNDHDLLFAAVHGGILESISCYTFLKEYSK